MSEQEFNFGSAFMETISGSEPDSVYLVVAKNDGLTLGIRPLVFPLEVLSNEKSKTAVVLHLGARVRVISSSPDGSTLTANSSFFPGFTDKGGHSSQVMGVPLAVAPCGLSEARGQWKDRQLTHLIAEALFIKLVSAGAVLLPCANSFVASVEGWLDTSYETYLPEVPVVDIKDDVTFGVKI